MNPQKHQKHSVILRLLPLLFCAVFAVGYLCCGREVSAQTLLEYTPKNPLLAAVVLWLLYALKSATIFFPLVVLEITAGHLFSPCAAIFVNVLGLSAALTIPYWIGRTSGMEAVQSLMEKYPRLGQLIDKQLDNSFFFCFFLRIAGGLPGDVVTMYLGATKIPYWKNLIAGLIGLFPRMFLATLIGESIQDPKSPMFLISSLLTFSMALLSLLFYHLYRRRLGRKRRTQE